MLIDIGLNLSSNRYDHDRDDVVARAIESGVERLVLTGTNLEESRMVAAYAERYAPYCYATAGVHPHEASSCSEEVLAELALLQKQPRVVAVGETGLDFNRNYSPPDAQEKAFIAQIGLAHESRLPLFLHERDAASRVLDILRAHRNDWRAGVLHCFTSDRETLHAYLDLGLYIGITGWVCDERRGQELQELVKEIPADRLLLETDGPYLLPRDMKPAPKDRRNESSYLPHIAMRVAALRQESLEFLTAATTESAKRLFGL